MPDASTPTPKPDAAIWPKTSDPAKTNHQRETVVQTAERLLQCQGNELAWCRDQSSYWFATRDPHDAEFTAERQPRYRWEIQPDGSKLGYLLS